MSNAASCKRRKTVTIYSIQTQNPPLLAKYVYTRNLSVFFYVALNVLTHGYKSNSQDDRNRHSTYSTTVVYFTYRQASKEVYR